MPVKWTTEALPERSSVYGWTLAVARWFALRTTGTRCTKLVYLPTITDSQDAGHPPQTILRLPLALLPPLLLLPLATFETPTSPGV